MSVSRRRFLTVGAAAAVGSLSGLGRRSPAWAALPAQRRPGGGAPDLFASSANFRPYLNTPFKLQLGSGRSGTVMLTNVSDFRLPAPRTAGTATGPGFSLTFDGSRLAAVPQGTYPFTHPQLGAFPMFLVPVGQGGDYQAVVNRLN